MQNIFGFWKFLIKISVGAMDVTLARFKKEYQIKKKYAHPLKMFQIYI